MREELKEILEEVVKGTEGSWEQFLDLRRKLGSEAKWDEPEACSNLELVTYLQTQDLNRLPLQTYLFLIDTLIRLPHMHQKLASKYNIKFQDIPHTTHPSLAQISICILSAILSIKIFKHPYRESEYEKICFTKCSQLVNEIKSENGIVHALLGKMYEYGIGVDIDHPAAAECYFKAASKDLSDSQYYLGSLYKFGTGVPKDHAEALKWIREAAEKGEANAQNDLGTFYSTGNGLPKDEMEAIKWLRKAADQGLAIAQFNLTMCLDLRTNADKNDAESIAWATKAAAQGFAKAQYYLGKCFSTGKGCPIDNTKAIEWFRKAADQGLAEAQFDLWIFLMKKNGTKNDAETASWLKKAAEQGVPNAQYHLGLNYFEGKGGVPHDETTGLEWIEKAAQRDHKKAKEYLQTRKLPQQIVSNSVSSTAKPPASIASNKNPQPQIPRKDVTTEKASLPPPIVDLHEISKAAENGDPEAIYILGQFYEKRDEGRDSNSAILHYRDAADKGHAGANFRLGLLYRQGEIVTLNLREAAAYMRKAAYKDHVEAQFYVGLDYQNGTGVIPNETQAKEWFAKAAAQGHEGARKSLLEMSAPKPAANEEQRPSNLPPIFKPAAATVEKRNLKEKKEQNSKRHKSRETELNGTSVINSTGAEISMTEETQISTPRLRQF